MSGRYLLSILAGLCGLWLCSVPAHAEGNCPAGHYPTYDQNGNQNGCYPVYDPNASTQPGAPQVATRPARPNVPVKNFFAGAWHGEARDAWIASGYRTAETAEQAALAACNRAMGQGCSVGFGGFNLSAALARGARGLLYSATGESDNKARNSVLDYCKKEGDFCEVISVNRFRSPGMAEMYMTYAEDPKLIAPTGNPRKTYGAVAFIDNKRLGTNPWVGDAWIVGGRSNADVAKADALALCERDMPSPCIVALVGADVAVGLATDESGGLIMQASASSKVAQQRALEACKADKKRKCKILRVVSLAQNTSNRVQVPAATVK